MGLETYWQNYKDRAEQAEKQQRFDIAEVMWSMAVLLSRQCSDGDRRLVFCLDRLGGALLRQRNTPLAHHFLTQSLQLKTTPLNLSDLDKSSTLNLLAQLHYMEGKLEKAEEYASQVHQIYTAALGAEHPQTKAAANNLALLRNTIGQMRNASLNQQALSPGQAQGPGQAVAPPGSQSSQKLPQTPVQQSLQAQAAPAVLPGSQSSQKLPQIPVQQSLQPQSTAQAMAGQLPRPTQDGQQGQKTTAGQVPPVSARPIAPTTPKKPTGQGSFDRCERGGEIIRGSECLQCTGTKLRAISPLDKLTKD